MDLDDVILSEWFGVLGSAVIAAVIVAVGLPTPTEVQAFSVVEKVQAPPNSVPQTGAQPGTLQP